ncbi:hypothetical protein Ddye_001819 [Dipteronia dyeriana]|uniref:DUF4378 domain-containing protein n=1 Tax=Dipteronia dyeriana TaxID=168575 RepID=A0AAD9XPZ3_9ROSI|nr:hypothetical protein Ddye_001819 [Dipteronia dyeriana]
MSTKLLDENPDLQKQIGCINGIFNIFDRHHFLSGRRFANHNQKRLPPGQNDNHEIKPHSASQRPKDKIPKKTIKEKKNISTQSSSSSCSSSLSSIECNKQQSQPETSPYGQANFLGTPIRNSHKYKPSDSSQFSQQHVDLRDVVKDSMHREARELSIKTATKVNAGGQILKYMDSPRPVHLQQPKTVKSRVSGLNESFRVLPSTLQETPLRKDGFMPKDAPRFSYDGRESRDAFKSTIKIKELPRLSLDSRERSMRSSNIEMKSNNLFGDLQRRNGKPNDILDQQQEPGSYKRPSSVVVKLMGLEAFPEPMLANGNQQGQMQTFPDVECDSFSRSSRPTDEIKHNRISGSPRNSRKEPVSPRTRNADSIKKPIASSKFPIETAPWRQPDGSKGQTPTSKSRETPAKPSISPLSVYGEIEKRLAQLEFKKSGTDLRALKQILEAMQKTKKMLESRKDQASNFVSQTGNNSSVYQSSKLDVKGDNPSYTTFKGTSSPKCFKSPIVIMKAAKSIKKEGDSVSSANLTENLSGLQRLCIGDSADNRKEAVGKRTTKDQTPKTIQLREPSSRQLHPKNKNNSTEALRSARTCKSPYPTIRKNKSAKSPELMNPRLQQKKLGFEKQSHPTYQLSDLSRTRRQVTESSSPRRKSGPKSPNLQQKSTQSFYISNDARDFSHQDDNTSLKSESNISMVSHIESEVTSTDRSDMAGDSFQQHGLKVGLNTLAHPHTIWILLLSAFIYAIQDPETWYTEDRSTIEPTKVGGEQPSPVSVLDATFYRDEPLSPVKKISHVFNDDEALNSNEAEWRLMDLNHSPSSGKPSFSSENNYGKVQNLRHIYPTHKDSIIDEIALINHSTDPDNRYISEILLASGLLRDVESDVMSFQLHPSGHLINPNLFLILEQNQESTGLLNAEHKDKKTIHSETTNEKDHRKLIFDTVDEILVHKLLLEGSSKQWVSQSKLVGKRPRQQQLLRDLCKEVDRLQANNSNCSLDDEEDCLTSIIWEDLMHGSINWTDCQSEISWLALDVERLIFKDLITEIVRDETTSLHCQPGRHCKQLFSS